jgi:hypothetical protein
MEVGTGEETARGVGATEMPFERGEGVARGGARWRDVEEGVR